MTKQAPSMGESVRARRSALRLSQRDVACAAGTTAAAVSHIERGIRKPSAGLLARLAAALQCSADDLLRGVVRTEDESPCIRQVVAAMRSFPPSVQKGVVEFCEYLKHRDKKSGKIAF